MNKQTRSSLGSALALALLAFSLPLSALSPPPPQPDDELLPLIYEALGGENWTRDDGWLDPEVHWCDWYGVVCGEQFWPGYFRLDALELADNGLTGELTPELSELLFMNLPADRLIDLSNNEISGQLYHFPLLTQQIDLSGNELEGPLPAITDDPAPLAERRLLLARNRFTGAVPADWAQLELRELDLADNGLESGHLNAFRAVSSVDWSRLDLAGNQFAGELPPDIFSARLYERGISNIGGGLDICFNDFVINDADVDQWIAARHVGGPDYAQCLGRERLPIDATISGSWFNTERAGEGVSVMLLENGAPLLYHFGFDTQGRQQWLFEVGVTGERFMQWDRLYETQGTFSAGLRFEETYPFVRDIARFRMDRVGNDTMHLHRHYFDMSDCSEWEQADPDRPPPGDCVPPSISDRMDYQRLSRLAGTSCENQSGHAQYSGAWYNSDRAGEGFIIEVLPDEQATVYWFTYKPDGSREQAWLIGDGVVGSFDALVDTPPAGQPESRIEIDTVLQPVGGTFGPDFDAADVQLIDWGSLIVDFYPDRTGRVAWNSDLEGYGSGEYEIESLARPMLLAECE